MNIDTLFDHSTETHQIEAFYNALKLIKMDVTSLASEGRFDDLYTADHDSVNDIETDDCWMDDLDEAA